MGLVEAHAHATAARPLLERDLGMTAALLIRDTDDTGEYAVTREGWNREQRRRTHTAAARTRARMSVPASTGIGAPGNQPAPASLANSPMSATPAASSASAIPFTRGSSIATMQDANKTYVAGATDQIQLQTNAFMQYVILDWVMVTSGNSAAVAFAADGPFNLILKIQLDDPAGQSIITPITGYQLFLLNKYLPDSGCRFDPQLDPNYTAVTGSGATGGSFSFRLLLPVEHRSRDALGAVNNSAGNQRYLVTLSIASTFTGTANMYSTAPTTGGTLTMQASQWYWTSPPNSITTTQGSVPIVQTPTGLGTVGFIRYERHNEISGGGSPQIQMNNVGDYISTMIMDLRNSSNAREATDWPSPWTWWVNDFQLHQLFLNVFQRRMARAYGYTAAIGSAGGLDTGVFILPGLNDTMFDKMENFAPANQYLATDATTKLQIRGATWGSGASYLEVLTRLIRPVSGAALFS